MAYIANKPVRFDRSYAVGEIIPDEVIDPKMTRHLVEMGRIICVDLSASGGSTETPPTPTQEDTEGETIQAEPEDAVEGAENGAQPISGSEDEPVPEPKAGDEFVCPDCGKVFSSRNALSAHSRTHKE